MIISDENIEIPDTCPINCRFKEELKQFYQGCMCDRCPILNCSYPDNDPMLPIISPESYRSDWAEEWKKFFDGEVEEPKLYLEFKNNE